MEEFLKLFSLRDILLHIANTLILFVAIRFLLYKPMRKFLDARAQKVAGELDSAAQKEAEASLALENANEEYRKAQAQAAGAMAEGAQRAQQSGEQILEAARQQADEIILKAKEEAERTKAAAQADIQAQALTMAVEIAEKMIGRELAEKDNETLAREFLTKVG